MPVKEVTKRCGKCGRSGRRAIFHQYVNKSGDVRLTSACMPCQVVIDRLRRDRIEQAAPEAAVMTEQTCLRCKQLQPIAAYPAQLTVRLQSWAFICLPQVQKCSRQQSAEG